MKYKTRRMISIIMMIMLIHAYIPGVVMAATTVATKEYEAGEKIPIVVEAPLETEKITAIVTTVKKIDLVYDEKSNKWVGEWTVPSEADPGEHLFKIIAVDFEGSVTEAETNKFIVIRKATTQELQQAKATEETGMGGPTEVLPLPVAPKMTEEEQPVAVEKVEAVQEQMAVEEKAPVIAAKESPVIAKEPEAAEEKASVTAAEEAPMVAEKPEEAVKTIPEAAKEAPKVAQVEVPEEFPIASYERSPGETVITHNLLSTFQTFVKTLAVTGVVGKDIKQVRINDEVIQVDEKGRFAANIPMNYGKNLIRFEVETNDGQIISKQSKMLRLVAQVHEFDYQAREQLFEEMTQEKRLALTLFGMYLERYIDMAGKINRAEAAKIIAKLYDYEINPVSGMVFPDVPADDEFAPYLQACKVKKVFVGYPDGKFRPRAPFSIAEFTAVFCDVEKLGAKGTMASGQGFWAKDSIAMVKDKGFIILPDFSNESEYRQPAKVEWIIEALNKTDKMKEKQSELMDWNTGYNK